MNPMNMLRDMRTIKKLLTDAELEARAMGEDQPGAEHLLLAALDLPDGSARRVLDGFGVDRERLRAAIVGQHAAALSSVRIDARRAELLSAPAPLEPAAGAGVYRSSATAQEAFQAASALARADKPSRFLGAHVIAAVAAMEHGTVARALMSLGILRDVLAAAALDEIRAVRTGAGR